MAQDFFLATQDALPKLNQTERALFDYVVRNMDKVKGMSIQQLANDRYLSKTTILRFAKKLGFTGYRDFTHSLLITEHRVHTAAVPDVLHNKPYADEYLKNVTEAVRVLPENKVERVLEFLARKPNVYVVADENCNDIGRYAERLFLGLGLRTYFPEVPYQVTAMLDLIRDGDLLVLLSFSGEDRTLVSTVEHILFEHKPLCVSITRADNNTIQNMSDVNFYVFADEIKQNSINLTSRVAMLMILELLVYRML
ncbi:MAG: MurR/RpiR family transcriptional regulator [Coriobacteriales bacterium]|jgi:RpiR family glv operon transcriptional regulator|nr:MurR/RpiR family transcriptional regulator [Coriobacteriales bacterium]